jgi:hypothetical protein
MWPFRKKPTSPDAVQSLQDFVQAYVPPEPAPVRNLIDVETVCPLCLDRFPPGRLASDFPFCPDCFSEGMDVEVTPLAEFLTGKSAQDFAEMLHRWEGAEGFLRQFKALKSERIRQLKALLELAGR